MNKDAVAEMSQQYQVEAAEKLVPKGYKQTEVGVIPEDWKVMRLEDVAILERGKFSARPRNDPKYYNGEYPFLQTGDIAHSKGKITSYSQTLNEAGLGVSRLFPKGTLFFTIAANIGDVGIAEFEAACPDSLVGITPRGKNSINWLLYELASRQEEFELLASPGAQLNLNLEKLRPFLTPVPNLSEQVAIANALSDTDALLSELEKLIVKKQAIKTATMQQLLTGRTRLPQFAHHPDGSKKGYKQSELGEIPEDWEVVALGDIVKIVRGEMITSKTIKPGLIPVIAGGKNPAYYHEIANRNGRTITVSASGASAGYVAFHEEPIFASDCSTISESSNYEIDFIYYSLCVRQELIYQSQTGGAQPHIHPKDLNPILIELPLMEEQTAIATILSDMDEEIQALEQRFNKTRQIKQGMMQELLTGKTRLLKGGKNV